MFKVIWCSKKGNVKSKTFADLADCVEFANKKRSPWVYRDGKRINIH